ncbi:uncharacterized protein [Typha angustifolia]|uniref:uncharacterized protein n=1 Tax=Typha angustifolia TaxID=59011 RepID=UPI003C2E9248
MEGNEEIHAEISMHAYTGANAPWILRVDGIVKNQMVRILINTGSTHNFMDKRMVKKIGIAIDATSRFNVALRDGTTLRANNICQGVLLKFQGNSFTLDLQPLALRGVDIVLGMEWMQSLGPMTFGFSEMWMDFKRSGKRVQLDEIRPRLGAQLQLMVGLPKTECHGFLMQLIQSQVGHAKEEEVPTDLFALLKEFNEMFEEPRGMPPAQPQDDRIEITFRAEPANVWPY